MSPSMTSLAEIVCQRGHDTHASVTRHITLAGPTAYADLTPIPFEASFDICIFDPDRYPIDAGHYCPAHDVVSATIDSLGVWDPSSTTLVGLTLGPGDRFLDLGCQIGWFSLLAASRGASVVAIDADPEPLRLLRDSLGMNKFDAVVRHTRITTQTPPLSFRSVRLAKLDLEGAEPEAVAMLRPMLSEGRIEHMLMEVSPVFSDAYPELVASVLDSGYEGYMVPPKSTPPVVITSPGQDLAPYRLDPASIHETVASWHQQDVWFRHEEASW